MSGLQPATIYHYRAVAVNAAGTVASPDRTFLTTRGITAVTLAVDEPTISWGGWVGVRGRITGLAVGGARVEVLRQDYPYTEPWRPLTTTATKSDGSWSTRLQGVFTTTHLQARAVGQEPVSTVATLQAALKIALLRGRTTGKTVLLRGSVFPAELGRNTVRIQRRIKDDRWTLVKTVKLRTTKGGRRTFRVEIPRRRAASTYRAVIMPRNLKANAPGLSRWVGTDRLR